MRRDTAVAHLGSTAWSDARPWGGAIDAFAQFVWKSRDQVLVSAARGPPVLEKSYIMKDIVTIDCQFGEPRRAAAYLLVQDGRAAFVDNNTARAVPHLLTALDAQGLQRASVDYVIVTHVHLDHAGGTASLVQACPNAIVLVHPAGERHLVDPSRLAAATKAAFEEDDFSEVFGPVEPVPRNRIKTVGPTEALPFADGSLRFFHTPGHAKHHLCMLHAESRAVFCGDAFGVTPPLIGDSYAPYLMCASPPPDFDAGDMARSVQLVAAEHPTRLYLTHYGCIRDVKAGVASLLSSIQRMDEITGAAASEHLRFEQLVGFCESRIRQVTTESLRHLPSQTILEVERWLEPYLRLNAKGLASAAAKRRELRLGAQ